METRRKRPLAFVALAKGNAFQENKSHYLSKEIGTQRVKNKAHEVCVDLMRKALYIRPIIVKNRMIKFDEHAFR